MGDSLSWLRVEGTSDPTVTFQFDLGPLLAQDHAVLSSRVEEADLERTVRDYPTTKGFEVAGSRASIAFGPEPVIRFPRHGGGLRWLSDVGDAADDETGLKLIT